mmetsp:Transcript_13936/g.21255  ORF Transcript_13936/g.21255 Transcript_13936/m.21255 type:complete len:182 (+) Transcript_13936:67-612(+)
MFSRLLLLVLCAVIACSYEYDEGPHWSDDAGKKRGGKVMKSVEKGFKCDGSGSMFKGFERTCQGGMSQAFKGSCKPHDMVEAIVEGVHEDLQGNYFPDVDTLMPSIDDMDEFEDMALLENDEEDGMFSKSFAFGGKVTMEWGCKVTYSMENGKFSKSNKCGFKAVSQSGKKEAEEVSLLIE